jgi:hypothetical protein
MNMTADDRNRRAGENMAFCLSRKYGDNWWDRMVNENVRKEWR